MSEATHDLQVLAAKLGRQRQQLPHLKINVLAEALILETSRTPEMLDRVLASATLNRRLFLSEATPERREVHQAILDAAMKYKQGQDKDRPNGVLIR